MSIKFNYILILSFFLLINVSAGQEISREDQSFINSSELDELSDSSKMMFYKKLCWDKRKYDRENAYIYGIKALELAQELNDYKEIAGINNYLGVVHRVSFDYQLIYPSALEHYFEALKTADEHGLDLEKAYALNNIGEVYRLEGKYDEALEYVSEAVSIAKKLNDKKQLAYIYFQVGHIHEGLNQLDSALFYHLEALKLRTEIKDIERIPATALSLAELYEKRKDFSKMKNILFDNIKYSNDIKDDDILLTTYVLIGSYYLNADNLSEAKKYLYKVIDAEGDGNLWKPKMKAALMLSDIFKIENKYNSAFKYLNLYNGLRDSLAETELVVKVQELSLNYKFNKEKNNLNKRQEEEVNQTRIIVVVLFIIILIITFLVIILIQKNNLKKEINEDLASKNNLISTQKKDLELYSNKLEELNKSKDKFFSIIAHDLRAPFNSILGYSDVLLKQIKTENYDDIELFSEMLYKVSKQSFNLLVNLLEWSRTQMGQIEFNPAVIKLRPLITTVIDLVRNSYNQKKILISVNVHRDLEVFADDNMLNTILRNLITNAFKFSNDGDKVVIKAESKNDAIQISIVDKGVGIEKDRIDDLFIIGNNTSTLGTNKEKGTGLGLILCKEFIEKHNGEIKVESKIGEGTTFSFTLPNKTS
ncbi:MAG: tetratricopeptide repeat-containing sensor histidine kinase [Melioribacteraceae bacterium]|nr:tetratricopeptide repeat-containing sensor histidine kinase [Melioribacteraceae bacterium]